MRWFMAMLAIIFVGCTHGAPERFTLLNNVQNNLGCVLKWNLDHNLELKRLFMGTYEQYQREVPNVVQDEDIFYCVEGSCLAPDFYGGLTQFFAEACEKLNLDEIEQSALLYAMSLPYTGEPRWPKE